MGLSAALIGGGLAAAGAVGGAVISSSGAKSAAKTQADATTAAAQLQDQQFQQVRNSLQPYMDAGAQALPELEDLTGTNAGGNPLTAPLTALFNPTIAQLEQTPGYQFTLNQGLKSTQNSYASQGLASSGAAQKGATDYAEGLAGTTYQQQFQNYLNQNSQIYNMVAGISGSGQNAAAGTGALQLNSTAQVNALNTAGANAQAAGTVASSNALGNGLTSAAALLQNDTGLFGSSNALTPPAYNIPSDGFTPVYPTSYG